MRECCEELLQAFLYSLKKKENYVFQGRHIKQRRTEGVTFCVTGYETTI
jgi:hypothetical protein